jgi:hypothetical protein
LLVSDEASDIGGTHCFIKHTSQRLKVRPVSQEHSRASIDKYVKMDVLSQGVSLDEFVKTVLDFDNNSYEILKTQANTWLTTSERQNTLAELSKVYSNMLKLGVSEQALYAPLSDTVIFILTNAMSVSNAANASAERRVKLALSYDKKLYGKGPDSCIFPERFELSPSASANATTADAPTTGVSSEVDNDDEDEVNGDIKWEFLIAPLEVKMFRSYDLRKLNKKNFAGSSKHVKTGYSADVSSSLPHDEPYMQAGDVFSEQTQSATTLHEDSGKQAKLMGHTGNPVQFANLAIKVLSCRGDRSFALVPVVTEQYISVSYYSREGHVESRVIDILNEPGGGNNQDNRPDLNQLHLEGHITTQVGAIGRGSSVYRLENTGYNMKLVAKYIYQVIGHRYEHDIIQAARRVGLVRVPEIFGHAIEGSVGIVKKLRDACPIKSTKYEEREFRVIVMRKYTTISVLGINEEFLHAMAQIMTCKSGTLFQ